MRNCRFCFLHIISVLYLFSCVKRPGADDFSGNICRTLIVYLAGDNNLSHEVKSKISALHAGFVKSDYERNRLVVFADYSSAESELLEITSDGIVTLKKYGDLNSSDPDVLKDVIGEIFSMYKSDSYGFLCFSHATGWLPPGAFSDPEGYAASTRSLFMDGSDEMEFADFSEAVRLPDGSKYDFMIFEMCHMAGIEVAYSLRNVSRNMIASSAEIVSPGFVEIYEDELYRLFSDIFDLKGFAEAYFAHCDGQSGARRSATVSVLDLDKIGLLARETGNIVKNGKYLISDPDGIQHFDRNMIHMFFDLREYLLAVTGGNIASLETFDELMKEVVLYAAATPSFMSGYPYSFRINYHSGLTVYIMQPQFSVLNEDYRKTGFFMDNLE